MSKADLISETGTPLRLAAPDDSWAEGHDGHYYFYRSRQDLEDGDDDDHVWFEDDGCCSDEDDDTEGLVHVRRADGRDMLLCGACYRERAGEVTLIPSLWTDNRTSLTAAWTVGKYVIVEAPGRRPRAGYIIQITEQWGGTVRVGVPGIGVHPYSRNGISRGPARPKCQIRYPTRADYDSGESDIGRTRLFTHDWDIAPDNPVPTINNDGCVDIVFGCVVQGLGMSARAVQRTFLQGIDWSEVPDTVIQRIWQKIFAYNDKAADRDHDKDVREAIDKALADYDNEPVDWIAEDGE